MTTPKTTLKQLEESFQQDNAGNLFQRLEIPSPDDPLYLLCTRINQFFERLSTPANTTNLNNPLFAAILENAPYGIVNIDTLGSINFSNRLADFLLGESNKSVNGLNLIEILAERKADSKSLRLIIDGNPGLQPQRTTISLPDKDDSITLSFTMIPYQDADNSQQQFSIFIEDLTGKNALSEAIESYTENLESMVKNKTKEIQAMQVKMIDAERAAAMIGTAGGIAHELRQPLTAIIGASELLADTPTKALDDGQVRKLNMIYQQSLRMADIIKKMEELVSYKTKDYVTGTKILDINGASKQK
ncbi:MAG: histidine kinase dimerization/phospho-acceptor domain-containing protein [Pseudomonadota bacterium]|nr:histidine kinase dimerization/phospho-acceptor domain-containing protein [Pseudomonadota bacterium]